MICVPLDLFQLSIFVVALGCCICYICLLMSNLLLRFLSLLISLRYTLILGLLVGQQQNINEETQLVGTREFAEYDRY